MINMISEEQLYEKIKRIKLLLSEINNSKNIKELSEKTRIPKSSVQRYLNDYDFLISNDLCTIDDLKTIRNWLKIAKNEGVSRGGKISQTRHGYEKNEKGEFTGNKSSNRTKL